MNLSGLTGEDKDNHFMKEALKQARRAFEAHEVPVGAVLVLEDRIIAKGYNQVEMLKDATAHAEILCLTAGSIKLNDWRLNETVLYITLEPCLMCAGAIYNARVKRIVWAAGDLRVGANGSWIDVFAQNHPIHQVEISSGILEEESSFLLKTFFQKQRKKNDLSSFAEASFRTDRAAEKYSVELCT